MKSRIKTHELLERKIEFSGGERMLVARSLALATALSLLLQPLTMSAPANAQENKSSSRFGSIFSKNHKQTLIVEKDDEETEAEEDAPKKTDPKKDVKKDSNKKDAKEAADEKKAQEKAKKDAVKNSEKAAKVEEAKEKAKAQAKAKADAAAKAVKKVEPKKEDDKAAKPKSTADDADKTAKKKKGGWFNRPKGAKDDDEVVVVEEEVVETAEPAAKAPVKPAAGPVTKTTAAPIAKPAATTPTASPAASAASGTAAVTSEKPVLLPDNALVSVLQDISKNLGELNETSGVETADDKIIVGLARQILDRSLGSGELKDNRILAAEHSNSAKHTMTTEAWASGDVVISDKLRGSVATVWGKRINGTLHVTIAGECQNQALSNGEKVGEFIVVVKGRSPVKSGFDIQSQSDVTYWIGAIDAISVEAACTRLKEKSAEGEAAPSSPTKSGDIKGEVKKKSRGVVLEAVLTHRRLQWLKAMALYQEQQQLLAQQLAEEALIENAVATASDTGRGASGDEVKAGKRKSVGDAADGERIAQRTDNKNDSAKTSNKITSSDDDEEDDVDEGDRVVRRSSDEDGDADRVARNPKTTSPAARKQADQSSDEDDEDQDSVQSSSTKDKTAQRVPSKTDSAKDERKPTEGDNEQKDADVKRVIADQKKSDERDEKSDNSKKTVVKTDEKQPKTPVVTANNSKSKDAEPGDTRKSAKNPWTNKFDESTTTSSSEASPSSKWPSTVATNTNVSATPSVSAIANPTIAKGEPAWKDDWSRDGGDSTIQNPLTTNQTSSHPGTTTPSPASTGPSLTRISALTPAPAQASSRAWESPALNLAPRSPSLGANLLYPERAIAGQFLTVSVLAKDKQPERSVELSFNGSTISTDAQGQALYMIPEDMPPGQTLHISLAERPEVSSKVVDILQQLDDGSTKRTPRIDRVSPFVAADGVLIIDGHEFDGLADKNRILIDNGVDARVIASSPVQLRILIPGKILPGSHTVTITDSNLRSTPAKFEFIKAEIEQPDVRKTKGMLDRVVVRIHGTKQPVPVRVVNRTPDVIKVSRGDNLLITTPGGNDNSSVLGVKQLKKGDYKLEASIEI